MKAGRATLSISVNQLLICKMGHRTAYLPLRSVVRINILKLVRNSDSKVMEGLYKCPR